MAYCTRCGAQLGDEMRFCPSCGKQAGPDGQEAPKDDVAANKGFAVLAYIGPLVLVPILGAKDSDYARYHANQGLVLFIFELCAYVARRLLGGINVLGRLWWVIDLALGAASVFFVVAMVLGIVNAAKGVKRPLPLIGEITILR